MTPAPVDRDSASRLLAAVARGQVEPHVRVYVPAPAVAFGRLDALAPGYGAAVAAARRHGFTPLGRATGGHAAPLHEGCVVVEEVGRGEAAMAEVHPRFADRCESLARMLRSLGVDAHVGEVAGEYCRGRYSVNARHQVKLIGTAQRVVRGAWLFGAVIVVCDPAPLRAVVADVYAALGLSVDAATVGAVAEEAPGVTVPDVCQALRDGYP